MATKKPRTSVNDYKDRMTSPLSITVTTNKKPKTTKATKAPKKGK